MRSYKLKGKINFIILLTSSLIILFKFIVINSTYLAAEKKLSENPIFSVENALNQYKVSSKQSVKLDVPLVSQLPELLYGCEITSTTMMLNYNGINVDKLTLANEMKIDTTEIVRDVDGTIVAWGNPNVGFVGDVTGEEAGFAIYPTAMIGSLEKYINPVDLTDEPYFKLEKYLSDGKSVVVWITSDFGNPTLDASWIVDGEEITCSFNQHTVLLTGYDKDYIYYNDPLTNEKNRAVDKQVFINSWQSIGSKALSYE
ncbi:C39 family peptidase [Clostridium senegalense]|uniref:C39 family peptidase n=1 Tax=Clostridium senegalense TaxID=1465809 RepID=UPI001C12005A|nr:C39 family peptidase [Clostridium senegalense]MBU5227313.1 C39 family peptidase [Clostridium senegalense]